MGIYKITNTKNKKVYIGSSKDIYRRWKEHLGKLENNSHHSTKLQRSYNATKDKSVFHFDIIEVVEDADKLKSREQFYIDQDAFHNGYNCSALADNPKYNQKTVSKAKRKAQLKERTEKAYFEFYFLYKPDCIFIDPNFLKGIHNGSFRSTTLNLLIFAMQWYYMNFDKSKYKIYLHCSRWGDEEYYFDIMDKNNNRFATYFHDRKNVYFSPYDTYTYQTILREKNIYDPSIHDYIIKMPVQEQMIAGTKLFNQNYQFYKEKVVD
jgi:hypothetical protein